MIKTMNEIMRCIARAQLLADDLFAKNEGDIHAKADELATDLYNAQEKAMSLMSTILRTEARHATDK